MRLVQGKAYFRKNTDGAESLFIYAFTAYDSTTKQIAIFDKGYLDLRRGVIISDLPTFIDKTEVLRLATQEETKKLKEAINDKRK